jgi:hypothetical protein
MNKPNLLVLVLAITYAVEQRLYFGGNMMPTNDAEMITDGIGFIILALAFVVPREKKHDS